MKSRNLRSPFQSAVLLLSAAAALWLASPACAQTTVTPSIAKNATGVAPGVPMKFTFSKAMDTAATEVTFVETSPSPGLVEVTTSWGAADKELTCTPASGNWPETATIQWILSATDLDGMPVTEPPFGTPPMGIFTTGTGGGPTDTDPPVLLSSSPTNNATAVPLNRSIKFTFNEGMQAAESIQWSANLTPASFGYAWSADSRTLTCTYSVNLPTNATVTWKLNPIGPPTLFKDAAGNALAADLYAGSFVTSNTTTNDLCNPEPGDDSLGSFSMSRQVSYVQTGSGTPVEDTNSLPTFSAALISPTNNPVTSASFTLPGGSSLDLTNFFGRTFFNFDEYASQAQLDASRPPGNYTLHVNRSAGGSQSLTLNHQAGDWPPTPQILNLVALQSADAASDLVVRWNGFAGAGAGDSIRFSLLLGNDLIYNAPDPCVPIPLEKTATSITLPKGLLVAGRTYDAELGYQHFGPFDTNSIADMVAFPSAFKELSFTIVTGGGTVPPKSPTIGSPSVTGNELQFQVTGASPGQSIQLQESATLLPGSWTTLKTIPADLLGQATFAIPITGEAGSRFYRLFTP